jgi:hypothetical protein
VREERCYRDGELYQEQGPAVVTQKADGSMKESYYHEGKGK